MMWLMWLIDSFSAIISPGTFLPPRIMVYSILGGLEKLFRGTELPPDQKRLGTDIL